jgi:thiol-disulfide isomerase/thioredoxin
MLKKMNAFLMCLALTTHHYFASASTRSPRQAVADVAVAGSVPQTGTSPESCLSIMDQLSERVYRESRESNREVDFKALRRERAKIANNCVAAFSVNAVPAEHLSTLAKLYFEAERKSEANKAISRYLKSPRATQADRAEVLRMAIDYSLFDAPTADTFDLAEKYLAQLDQLGDLVIRQRISARLLLVGHYLSARDDAKALLHETEIANLSKGLPADAQKAALDEAIGTIEFRAMFDANDAGAARALAIVEKTSPELIRLAHAEEWLERTLSRYRMNGQEAPQLFPRNVLNAQNSDDPGKPQKGRVTIMLFAAYWCGPCHAIYPQVIDVYRRLQDSGVQALLVTQLSNPANDSKAPKPDEELATIQKFYVDEVKLPFPIVVEGPVDEKSSGAMNIDLQRTNRQWRLFSFYPMILLIDKQGRTRAILMGTPAGQGERLRAKIEELLREPA